MTQKPTPPRNNDPATFAKELTPLYTLKGHKREVTSVGVSYGSRIIVSGSWDKTIKIWNGLDGTLLRTLDEHSEGALSVALSSDAHTIASADHGHNVKIWNTLDGTVLRTLNQAGETVAISPDGRTIACGGYFDIQIYDMFEGTLLRTLKGHRSTISSIAFGANGRMIVSGSGDKTVRVWDALEGKPLRTFGLHTEISRVVSSSRGGSSSRPATIGTIVSGNWDKTITIWKGLLNDLKDDPLLTLNAHEGGGICVALSPDGRTIVSGCSADFHVQRDGKTIRLRKDDKTIKIWKVLDGTLLRTLKGHRSSVSCLAFSPDGLTMVSGSDDCTIKVWGAKGRPTSVAEVEAMLNSPPTSLPKIDMDIQFLAVGDMSMKMGNFTAALEAYEVAIHHNPNSAEAYSGKSDALFKLGRIEEAQQAKEKAQQLENSSK